MIFMGGKAIQDQVTSEILRNQKHIKKIIKSKNVMIKGKLIKGKKAQSQTFDRTLNTHYYKFLMVYTSYYIPYGLYFLHNFWLLSIHTRVPDSPMRHISVSRSDLTIVITNPSHLINLPSKELLFYFLWFLQTFLQVILKIL